MLTFAAHALILASPYSPQPAVETPGVGYPGPGVGYPGPQHAIPTIHFIPTYVSDRGGWHDVAGAFTHKGVHHIWQGTGWNHAVSHDLVKWSTAPHGPKAVHETYKGMDSETDPCSGFVTLDKDGDGSVCAGFRQCGSKKGVDGFPHPWDVPLELRCALDDNLTTWNDAAPEYLFNVSFWRGIPYDPARPWKESDGNWYQLLSMDGCNATTHKIPCAAGGQLDMWKSPALRGEDAAWTYVGPVLTTNATVLANGFLTKEFVTIDFIGRLPGDPKPDGLGTRLFLNNVGGNGGGEGCCAGTTSYFVIEQSAPGAVFKEVAPQGMVDWGAFRLHLPVEPQDGASAPTGLALLDGDGSRGLSMARTLGSDEPDQVTQPGRRVLIGWTGPNAIGLPPNTGSAQGLPRELSLAPDRSLLQRFVPELEKLRVGPAINAYGRDAWFPRQAGLQVEVRAQLPASCATTPNAACGVAVLGDALGATTVTLSTDLGLVIVDATSQSNNAVRAGPLPPARAGAVPWTIHLIADHSIVEVIVNNATAFVVYALPATTSAGHVRLVGVPANATGAVLDAWPLADAGHVYSS